jgi:hypothetical protein
VKSNELVLRSPFAVAGLALLLRADENSGLKIGKMVDIEKGVRDGGEERDTSQQTERNGHEDSVRATFQAYQF